MKGTRRRRLHYPPGSLIYRGRERDEHAWARIVRFNQQSFEELQYAGDPGTLSPREGLVTWIHVNGIHDAELIGTIGNIFQMHSLMLEDILHTETLPKQEDFDNAMYVSLNAMSYDAELQALSTSNISLVLMKNVFISYQEAGPDVSQIIFERLRDNLGILRTRKEDYLFYRFIDVIVDDYKVILDHIEDRSEELEESSILISEQSNAGEIHQLRRLLNRMRRNVSPLQMIVNRLYLEPEGYFQEQTMHFLRDLLDDIEHINQRIESAREDLLNIMDINYMNISVKTNEVVRLLTIVSTIFIPLTFLAGVYGMNFKYMPELYWKYGYAACWALMLFIFAGMLVYFKRNRWL